MVDVPTVTIIPNKPIACYGDSIEFTASGANSYTWSTGSTNTLIVATPTANFSYSLTGVTVNNCVGSDVLTMTVYPLPTITINSPDSVICAGNSASLTPIGAIGYVWNYTLATTVYTASPSSTTIYTVQGFDPIGCSSTITFTVRVSPCIGIHELAEDTKVISIYPNPTKDKFLLDLNKSSENSSIEIEDVFGKMILRKKITSGKIEIDISDFADGLYILRIITNEKYFDHFKLIKQ